MRPTALFVVLSVAFLGVAGCQRAAPAADAKADSAEPAQKEEGVTLSAEQVQKVGIVTEPARSVDYVPETVGYGVVVSHDAVATAVAELATAQAAQAQSRAVAARAQRLAGTSGALSADVVESAARQAAADSAQLALAERLLSTVIGGALPANLGGASVLQDLASGKVKLLRATFPLGALRGATPTTLRAARLDAPVAGAAQSGAGWKLGPVWNAPADATLPGRSFFALLKGGDVGEGERLLVWAPGAGPTERGVTVPASAVVISDGKYWCYLQSKPGHYVRKEVATDKPVADGYAVTSGIAAGDPVVTAAAGLLLAREMNPSTEAD